MPAILASFVCGLVFGAGLLISGMNQPEKVLGFLDIFGAWDATLAFVMAGAVAVASIGFALARRRAAPLFAAKFSWPERRDIDAPKRIRGRSERVNHRGANDGSMSDCQDFAGHMALSVEPGRDAPEQLGDRFAAMGSGPRVAQPCRQAQRISRMHLVERPAGPFAVVALAQQGLDDRG